MTTLTFGEKLMLLRKKKSISQKKLAELLGIAIQNMPRYEKDDYLPKPEILIKLADIFGVSIDYLLIDSHQNPEPMNILDTELLQLVKAIDNLNENEKNRLKNLVKSYLDSQRN
ncbi:MAG: helix-turn-helix transcriptional regulator [bacterium]|nr:helix-turn-helix transcriptional regulator [bacterium]